MENEVTGVASLKLAFSHICVDIEGSEAMHQAEETDSHSEGVKHEMAVS